MQKCFSFFFLSFELVWLIICYFITMGSNSSHRKGCNDQRFDWQGWIVNVFPPCVLMASHSVVSALPLFSYLLHLLLTGREVRRYVAVILHLDFGESGNVRINLKRKSTVTFLEAYAPADFRSYHRIRG